MCVYVDTIVSVSVCPCVSLCVFACARTRKQFPIFLLQHMYVCNNILMTVYACVCVCVYQRPSSVSAVNRKQSDPLIR